MLSLQSERCRPCDSRWLSATEFAPPSRPHAQACKDKGWNRWYLASLRVEAHLLPDLVSGFENTFAGFMGCFGSPQGSLYANAGVPGDQLLHVTRTLPVWCWWTRVAGKGKRSRQTAGRTVPLVTTVEMCHGVYTATRRRHWPLASLRLRPTQLAALKPAATSPCHALLAILWTGTE